MRKILLGIAVTAVAIVAMSATAFAGCHGGGGNRGGYYQQPAAVVPVAVCEVVDCVTLGEHYHDDGILVTHYYGDGCVNHDQYGYYCGGGHCY